jgi:hypothetical protein
MADKSALSVFSIRSPGLAGSPWATNMAPLRGSIRLRLFLFICVNLRSSAVRLRLNLCAFAALREIFLRFLFASLRGRYSQPVAP